MSGVDAGKVRARQCFEQHYADLYRHLGMLTEDTFELDEIDEGGNYKDCSVNMNWPHWEAAFEAGAAYAQGSQATPLIPTTRDWVKCPVCGQPDMRQETDGDGNRLIFCVNLGCASNGGNYSEIACSACAKAIIELKKYLNQCEGETVIGGIRNLAQAMMGREEEIEQLNRELAADQSERPAVAPQSAPGPQLLCDQVEEVTLASHLKHVEAFLQEMYATMVDPVEQPHMKVADLCELLLRRAREDREALHSQSVAPPEAERQPRRMQANLLVSYSPNSHYVEHDYNPPRCDYDPKCVPVAERTQQEEK
jgi:hypothetical protein